MPQPGQEVMLPGPLYDVAIQYSNRLYIADRVFPLLDRVPPEAKILEFLRGAWFRDEATMMGPSSEAGRGGYPIRWLDVIPKQYGFAKEVTDFDREANAAMGGSLLDPDTKAIKFAQDKVLLKREVRLSTLIKATSWSGVGAGGTDADGKWAAGAGNTFLADIKGKMALMQSATGFLPNKLLLDNGTMMSLTEESTILEKIKYTQKAVASPDLLASVLSFGNEPFEIIVAGAGTSTAKELKTGLDFTFAKMWEVNAGKGMGFLFYAPPAPSREEPSAGYMARGGTGDGFQNGIRITTWRESAKHQDLYEAAEKLDVIVTGSYLGFMWKDTLLT